VSSLTHTFIPYIFSSLSYLGSLFFLSQSSLFLLILIPLIIFKLPFYPVIILVSFFSNLIWRGIGDFSNCFLEHLNIWFVFCYCCLLSLL
jgi:hypothetical protein